MVLPGTFSLTSCHLHSALSLLVAAVALPSPALAHPGESARCSRAAAALAGVDPFELVSGPALLAAAGGTATDLSASPPFSNPFTVRNDHLADTDLIHNLLQIEVVPGTTTASLVGSNTMTLTSLVPAGAGGLSSFVFQLAPNLTVTAAEVDGIAMPLPVIESGSARRVQLPRAYFAGEQFAVKISYSGTPSSGAVFIGANFFHSLSQTGHAGDWMPCKEADDGTRGDNRDKSLWDIWVTHSSTRSAVANGTRQGIDTLSGNRRRTRFSCRYPMSTYLACVAVDSYTTASFNYSYPLPAGGTGTMPVEFFGFGSTVSNAMRQVGDMLDAFRRAYTLYPWIEERYAIYKFGFSGGMEHQTTTGQSIISDPSLNAHELAHQWWGDSVTCASWMDVWLNEGFATYSEAIWTEYAPGGSKAAYLSTMAAMRATAANASRTVYKWGTYTFRGYFDEASYEGGAWVLHMLRRRLGDAAFFATLRNYYNLYHGGTATTADFFAVAQSTSGLDLTRFADQWLNSKDDPTVVVTAQPFSAFSRDYVRVSISQGNTNLEFPLDLRFGFGSSTLTSAVLVDAPTEVFTVPAPSGLAAAAASGSGAWSRAVDPEGWLLYRTAPVIAVGTVTAPPVLLETIPAAGAQFDAGSLPLEVVLRFSAALALQPGDITLTGLVGEIPTTIAPAVGGSEIHVQLPPGLRGGAYQIRWRDGVLGLDGQTLDGELTDRGVAGGLPSGDGAPGGAGAFAFTVSGLPCPADFTADSFVDDADFVFFAAQYDLFSIPPAAPAADLNGDGFVDDGDFVIFSAAYDQFACP